jgi:predicted metal-dependent HD superfamily phosphohydrolase
MHQEKKSKYILDEISEFVTQLFNEKMPGWAVYHNLSHTLETVTGCKEIGRGSGLKDEDLEILSVAAWLHDTGYIYQVDEHEEKSSEIAISFLNKRGYPADRINTVINCILATKISVTPKNLMESVICDSDLISLGSPDYFKKNDLLKLEIERRENIKITDFDWLKRSLNFLAKHSYFTDYAKIKYGSQIENNIITLQKMIKEY